MSLIRTRSFLLVFSISACLGWMSCSSGPKPPEKGTPAFYWSAAKETWTATDYLKTRDHLAALLRTENEFTARAQPWLLILTSGLAHGYMAVADSFELGGRANKANPTPFRMQTNNHRTVANQLALGFAEAFEKFQKSNKDPNIALAFSFPTGSPALVMELSKAGSGVMLSEGEIETGRKRAIERAVLMDVAKAVGAPEDTAKAQQVLKGENPQIPRATFILFTAQTLYDLSQLYTNTKLDQPERLKLLAERAQAALKEVPEGKETKELTKKIEAALKTAKGR